MKRLALKYRPKIFAEVRGQDHPKRVISQLVLNNRSCANLLLYGSIGSGKTSLIRIYAKAINCQNVTAAGDRCFKCGPCTSVDKEGDEKRLERDSSIFSGLKELDTPTFRDSKDLKDELDGLLMEPIPAGRRRVIFFDEAHVLSKIKNVFDYLLKKVEEPPPNVAFCFATTALEQMSDALRSRTLELEVRPLTHDLSVELLTKASANEGIKFHDEALSLLAGLGEHQPRNMLQALDKMCLISNGAEITRDRVATVFGVDYIDNLVQYFEAVGAGEFEAQITKFLQWPDATRRKVRLIQLFLIGLYYVDLCGLIVSIDPVISSIRKEERKRVVDAFKHRLPGIDLKAFFEDLLSVWPVVTDDLSDEALLATVMRFQTVANRGVVAPRMQAMTERIVPEAVAEIGPASGPKRRTGTKDEDANAPKDPAYLGRSHIRSIFAASSFLVQTGHQPFNARITIRHRLFGHEGQPEASEHFKRFSQALKGRLKHWGGSGLRVFVQERTEEEGSCGRVIAQVPDPNVAASWFKKWHRSSRVAGEMEAIEFEVVPSAANLDGHWSCVRWLCGGFNPEDPIHSNLNIEPQRRRRAGEIGQRTRVDYSESLGVAARLKEEDECGGLKLVSAFDDEQFARLYDGWELEECEFRREQRLRWQEAIADIKARFPLNGSDRAQEMQDYEVVELRKCWSPQQRSWPIWSAP